MLASHDFSNGDLVDSINRLEYIIKNEPGFHSAHHLYIQALIKLNLNCKKKDAIKNAINKIDLEKFSNSILYICRVKIYKKKFVFGLAKPCDGCMKAISTFNIKKVYYTLDNGGYDLL